MFECLTSSLLVCLSVSILGFLPLEPSMGGIEECEGSSCHGALMEMTAAEVRDRGGIKIREKVLKTKIWDR